MSKTAFNFQFECTVCSAVSNANDGLKRHNREHLRVRISHLATIRARSEVRLENIKMAIRTRATFCRWQGSEAERENQAIDENQIKSAICSAQSPSDSPTLEEADTLWLRLRPLGAARLMPIDEAVAGVGVQWRNVCEPAGVSRSLSAQRELFNALILSARSSSLTPSPPPPPPPAPLPSASPSPLLSPPSPCTPPSSS